MSQVGSVGGNLSWNPRRIKTWLLTGLELEGLEWSGDSLDVQGNCYSDNEKTLLEQMRRMREEHHRDIRSSLFAFFCTFGC